MVQDRGIGRRLGGSVVAPQPVLGDTQQYARFKVKTIYKNNQKLKNNKNSKISLIDYHNT